MRELLIPSKLNPGDKVAFIHSTPMTVLPVGAQMEIDCDGPIIKILESGVL